MELGKDRNIKEVNHDSTLLSPSFTMNTFDFTLTTHPLTQTTNDTSPVTATSLMRIEKKEKEMVSTNPNVLQAQDVVRPKGKCVGFQELEGTLENTSVDIEALKVQFTTLDECKVSPIFAVKVTHAVTTKL